MFLVSLTLQNNSKTKMRWKWTLGSWGKWKRSRKSRNSWNSFWWDPHMEGKITEMKDQIDPLYHLQDGRIKDCLSGLCFKWESLLSFTLGSPASTTPMSLPCLFHAHLTPRISTPSLRLNPDLVERDHYCTARIKYMSNWCGLMSLHFPHFPGTREMVEDKISICPVKRDYSVRR